MDFSNPRQRAAFFEIHRDLPREGPGDGASTRRALSLARPHAAAPRVLDIACGPGEQTLDLAAALPDASIVALDYFPHYLDELHRRATAAGIDDRLQLIRGDMAALDFQPASFDLIWCEGAAYIMGVAEALGAWRRFLRPGGRIALTEAVWLRGDPPERVRRNWTEYPAMVDVAGTRRRFEAAGYELLGDFVLPQEAWWVGYYGPMEARIEEIGRRFDGDPDAALVLAEAREEIDCYRQYPDVFGYAFFVATIP